MVEEKQQSSGYGWVVTFAGTGVNLALGALYAWSVFKGPLQGAPYNLTASESNLPYSICIAVFALIMMPAGRMQDKIGPKFVIMLGGLLVGAGFMLSGFAVAGGAVNLALLVIGFGVLAGTGIGMGYSSATPPAVKWFHPQKKGLIVGLVVGGFGLASVYIAPLTTKLVTGHNISYAFYVLGIIFFVAILVLSQFIKNPPVGYKPAVPAAKTGAPPAKVKKAIDRTPAQMLKTFQFYLLWVIFAFGTGAGLIIISFLAKVIKDNNVKLGFWTVAILAVGNASGRIIAGTVSDKLGRKLTLFIILAVEAIVLSLFGKMATTEVLAAVGAFCVGFTYGAHLSLFPSIIADFYGLKNLGINYGLVFTAWGFGGVVMPMIAAHIYDASMPHSYAKAYIIAAVICAVGALLTFALKPPVHKEEAAA